VLLPLIPAADRALLWWLLVSVTAAWGAILMPAARGGLSTGCQPSA